MMNKVNKLNELVTEHAMKTMGFRIPNDASHYMWGYYRGLLNHLESSIPGVAKELELEIYRQGRKGI
jgi:hypothetical protein